MNVGVALREFLLEGFLVARELDGGGAGGRVSGATARGCCGACSVGMAGDVGAAVGSGCGDRTDSGGTGSRLVGVSAITADVGAVVVLAAVPVSTSALVAVRAPAVIVLVAAALGVAAVVIALAPVAIPASAVAASVLFWVCESGVVSQGWVGELVEGWPRRGVDGALWGA